jgi:hypothetical protein
MLTWDTVYNSFANIFFHDPYFAKVLQMNTHCSTKYISYILPTCCLRLVTYDSTNLMFKHWQDEDQVGWLHSCTQGMIIEVVGACTYTRMCVCVHARAHVCVCVCVCVEVRWTASCMHTYLLHVELHSQVTPTEVWSDGTCCHSWPLPTACYSHSTHHHWGGYSTRNCCHSWRWSTGCTAWRWHWSNNSLGFSTTAK